LVAYLDANEPAHDAVADSLDSFTGRLLTTGAVVTEAMHFVGGHRSGPELLLRFLEQSRAEIVECVRLAELRATVALMEKYADTPMDFADATLVLAAAARELEEVCTLDRRGFAIYRTPAGRAFRLVLNL